MASCFLSSPRIHSPPDSLMRRTSVTKVSGNRVFQQAAKRVPLTGLDVRRCDGLRSLEERLRIVRRLSSDFRRQPKVAFGLRDVNIGIWKDTLSVLSGETADVIGMEVRDQNDADFFRRIACAAEVARQAPERSLTIPGAGTRIDED